MATVNFSVPDEIKKRFNKVFSHQNKSHLIAQLMLQAIEEYELEQQRSKSIEALLNLRAEQRPVSTKRVKAARERGRQ